MSRMGDSTMRLATDVFSEWAEQGKDVGMEKGHGPAVGEILAAGIAELDSTNFSAIDAGCGNGWVVRMLSSMENCKSAIGVDGAKSMIERAKEIDSATYIHADLLSWKPEVAVDFVHSMEVLYYLNDIPQFLKSVKEHWLKEGGVLAFGVDHYHENQNCHNWSEKVGTPMAMYRESEWQGMVEMAGFTILQAFRAAPGPDWAGTLAIIARNS
jgi:predicted TPR repeat methyltransferase